MVGIAESYEKALEIIALVFVTAAGFIMLQIMSFHFWIELDCILIANNTFTNGMFGI